MPKQLDSDEQNVKIKSYSDENKIKYSRSLTIYYDIHTYISS